MKNISGDRTFLNEHSDLRRCCWVGGSRRFEETRVFETSGTAHPATKRRSAHSVLPLLTQHCAAHFYHLTIHLECYSS
jgi:hypothetical protein